MELDADMFACRRIAEKMASCGYNQDIMNALHYRDMELLYYDTLRGIRAVFFVLEYLEIVESIRLHENAMKLGRSGMSAMQPPKRNSHPPVMYRCYYSLRAIEEHMATYFHFKGSRRRLTNIYLSGEKDFGGISLSPGKFMKTYGNLFNGSMKNTYQMIQKYSYEVLRNELMPYSRIPL